MSRRGCAYLHGRGHPKKIGGKGRHMKKKFDFDCIILTIRLLACIITLIACIFESEIISDIGLGVIVITFAIRFCYHRIKGA